MKTDSLRAQTNKAFTMLTWYSQASLFLPLPLPILKSKYNFLPMNYLSPAKEISTTGSKPESQKC